MHPIQPHAHATRTQMHAHSHSHLPYTTIHCALHFIPHVYTFLSFQHMYSYFTSNTSITIHIYPYLTFTATFPFVRKLDISYSICTIIYLRLTHTLSIPILLLWVPTSIKLFPCLFCISHSSRCLTFLPISRFLFLLPPPLSLSPTHILIPFLFHLAFLHPVLPSYTYGPGR